MPLRIIRAELVKLAQKYCPENAEAFADDLIASGWRPPTITITEESDLDGIPNGSAVLIGNLKDPSTIPVVGVKATHCILITGEDQPYPFHQDGLAPPLPCTAVWIRGEDLNEPVQSDADGVNAAYLLQQHIANAPGDFH